MHTKIYVSILLILAFVQSIAQDSTKVLPPIQLELEGAEIQGTRDGNEGLMQMRTVDNFGIYAGRKTEIIVPSENSGNNSTNQAREQFAKIGGLNIWEDPSGLQINIGGRGLDPNRSSNFNTRQGAYNISADPLGYPESYYSPMINSVERIEILRGTSALQYGSQFGGMIRYKMKKGRKDEQLHLQSENGLSSFNTWHSFNSIDGTYKGFDYYFSGQLRSGDGWRNNSEFDSQQLFLSIGKSINDKLRFGLEFSHLQYLSKQAGGLTDTQFLIDPQQSFRDRNWFRIDWNILAIQMDYRKSAKLEYTANFALLDAERNALGFLGKISRTDLGDERDLIAGNFNNLEFEQRMVHRHLLFKHVGALVMGSYHFSGNTNSRQGKADDGNGPSFRFLENEYLSGSDFNFSSENHALFAEEALFLSEKLILSTGLRLEYINTGSAGYYTLTETDGAGNVLPGYPRQINDSRSNIRKIFLAGFGLEFKPSTSKILYFNFTRNYRALNFSDLYINLPGLRIDQNIRDEQGFSADLGLKFRKKKIFSEITAFGILYKDRIGLINSTETDPWLGTVPVNLRTNVGNAIIAGLEFYTEFKWEIGENTILKPFVNASYTHAQYADENRFKGNRLEYVPMWTSRAGLSIQKKNWKLNYLFSGTGLQYTDADNSEFKTDPDAVTGAIPAWYVQDLSLSKSYKWFEFKAGSNNLFNNYYFSRRANGYPGPGILPSDGRSFYISIKADIHLL